MKALAFLASSSSLEGCGVMKTWGCNIWNSLSRRRGAQSCRSRTVDGNWYAREMKNCEPAAAKGGFKPPGHCEENETALQPAWSEVMDGMTGPGEVAMSPPDASSARTHPISGRSIMPLASIALRIQTRWQYRPWGSRIAHDAFAHINAQLRIYTWKVNRA